MKKTLLCVLLTAAALFTACAGGVTETVTETETGAVTTEAAGSETAAAETAAETEKVTEEETEKIDDGPDEWEGYHVKKLLIADRDISEYRIVYQPGADGTVKNAAFDLRNYIRDATGTELYCAEAGDMTDYEICVGNTDRDTEKVKAERGKLKNNGYAIIQDGTRLYLTGDGDTGAMYAVYSFLEDILGWRFYSSKFEVLKFSKKINVKAGTRISYSPAIINRDTFWWDTFDDTFAAKRKINGFMNREMKDRGETMIYAGPFVHSLPEFAGTPKTPNVQPCLTDPAVYEKVLANVKACLRANPGAKIISVSQNDSFANGVGCQCENCKKIDDEEGTPMGSLLTFVNRIADDIKDEFPGVYVDTLAYRYTRKAPKNIKPRDNVIIRLCTIECCMAHPLSASCKENHEFMSDLKAWAAICDNLFIWDYTTDFMYYSIPFPNLHTLYDNVKIFSENNVIGMFEQGNGQCTSAEFGELRAYLLSKMMWDPNMTREEYDELMNEFLADYYGAGWQYIREFIDSTEKRNLMNHMTLYDPVEKTLVFEGAKTAKAKLKKLNEYIDLWQKAYDAADDERKSNVERSSIQVKYTELLMNWDKDAPERMKDLFALIRKYGIRFYREDKRVPNTPDYNTPLANW